MYSRSPRVAAEEWSSGRGSRGPDAHRLPSKTYTVFRLTPAALKPPIEAGAGLPTAPCRIEGSACRYCRRRLAQWRGHFRLAVRSAVRRRDDISEHDRKADQPEREAEQSTEDQDHEPGLVRQPEAVDQASDPCRQLNKPADSREDAADDDDSDRGPEERVEVGHEVVLAGVGDLRERAAVDEHENDADCRGHQARGQDDEPGNPCLGDHGLCHVNHLRRDRLAAQAPVAGPLAPGGSGRGSPPSHNPPMATALSLTHLGSLMRGVRSVDQVGADERAASLAKRSIKKSSKLWALDLAVRCVDLTTLEGADTPGKIAAMCAKAIRPKPGDATIPSVAAVCVYPLRIADCVEHLRGSAVRIASVATAFPSGQSFTPIKVAETEQAVKAGAHRS